MSLIFYPDQKRVLDSFQVDDPVLILIKHDQSEIIVANLDDCGEHYILLAKAGRSMNDIDKYFRVVADSNGADWTFVCPADYKGITNRDYRIKQFYNDGTDAITKALKALNLPQILNIPKRYQRHLDVFRDY